MAGLLYSQPYRFRHAGPLREGARSTASLNRTACFIMMGLKGLLRGRGSRYTVAPLPVQRTAVAPTEFTEVSAGHYFVDFGRVAFAGLELTVPEPEHGRIVT